MYIYMVDGNCLDEELLPGLGEDFEAAGVEHHIVRNASVLGLPQARVA